MQRKPRALKGGGNGFFALPETISGILEKVRKERDAPIVVPKKKMCKNCALGTDEGLGCKLVSANCVNSPTRPYFEKKEMEEVELVEIGPETY